MLFDTFDKVSLPTEARQFYFMVCSLVNTKRRIEGEMKLMPAELTKATWWTKFISFLEHNTCSYPDEEVPGSVFATIHTSSTFPGLALYFFMIARPKEERTYDVVRKHQVFGQLALDTTLQQAHKEVMRRFWTSTVRTTTRRNRPMKEIEKLGTEEAFDEEKYKEYTQGDKYVLYDPVTKTILPATGTTEDPGYTREDIDTWIKLLNEHTDSLEVAQ